MTRHNWKTLRWRRSQWRFTRDKFRQMWWFLYFSTKIHFRKIVLFFELLNFPRFPRTVLFLRPIRFRYTLGDSSSIAYLRTLRETRRLAPSGKFPGWHPLCRRKTPDSMQFKPFRLNFHWMSFSSISQCRRQASSGSFLILERRRYKGAFFIYLFEPNLRFKENLTPASLLDLCHHLSVVLDTCANEVVSVCFCFSFLVCFVLFFPMKLHHQGHLKYYLFWNRKKKKKNMYTVIQSWNLRREWNMF